MASCQQPQPALDETYSQGWHMPGLNNTCRRQLVHNHNMHSFIIPNCRISKTRLSDTLLLESFMISSLEPTMTSTLFLQWWRPLAEANNSETKPAMAKKWVFATRLVAVLYSTCNLEAMAALEPTRRHLHDDTSNGLRRQRRLQGQGLVVAAGVCCRNTLGPRELETRP